MSPKPKAYQGKALDAQRVERDCIIKVQVAQMGFGAGKLLLIYDEQDTFKVQVEDALLLKRMRGAPKAYFYARVTTTKGIASFLVTDDAPEQDW